MVPMDSAHASARGSRSLRRREMSLRASRIRARIPASMPMGYSGAHPGSPWTAASAAIVWNETENPMPATASRSGLSASGLPVMADVRRRGSRPCFVVMSISSGISPLLPVPAGQPHPVHEPLHRAPGSRREQDPREGDSRYPPEHDQHDGDHDGGPG